MISITEYTQYLPRPKDLDPFPAPPSPYIVGRALHRPVKKTFPAHHWFGAPCILLWSSIFQLMPWSMQFSDKNMFIRLRTQKIKLIGEFFVRFGLTIE